MGMRTKSTARREAERLLRSPYFFREFLSDMRKGGLVGEEQNASLVYTVATSRVRPRPLNLLVKGQSAAGKNFLVGSVMELLPAGSVHELTGASEKGFYNLEEEELMHSVVYLQERSESAGTIHPSRLLISEGRLIRFVSVRRGGGWVTERQETAGPVAFVSTTTEDKVQIDDETRHVSIWIDESQEQTERLLELNPGGGFHLPEKRKKIWHEVQRLIEERASIPIKFPRWRQSLVRFTRTDDIRVRRYFPSFVRAWETVTLIRSFLRPREEIRKGNKLESTFGDYAVTAIIFNSAFAESLYRPSGRSLETRHHVERISAKKDGAPVEAADLAQELNISFDRAYSRLRRAAKAGTIRRAGPSVRRNRKLYLPTPPPVFVPNPGEVFPKLGLRGRAKFVHPLTGEWVVCGGQARRK